MKQKNTLLSATLCALMPLMLASCSVNPNYTSGPAALSESHVEQTLQAYLAKSPTTMQEMRSLFGEPSHVGNGDKGVYSNWTYIRGNIYQKLPIYYASAACQSQGDRIIDCAMRIEAQRQCRTYGKASLYGSTPIRQQVAEAYDNAGIQLPTPPPSLSETVGTAAVQGLVQGANQAVITTTAAPAPVAAPASSGNSNPEWLQRLHEENRRKWNEAEATKQRINEERALRGAPRLY